MVLGMRLGSRKKQSKEPDLSRYDYHYNKPDVYYKSGLLSADAAYAATVNANSNGNASGRTYSMVNTRKRGSVDLGGGFKGGRSYSMMSRAPAVHGNRNVSVGSQRTPPIRGGQFGSRTNSLRNGSLIIKTHEVKDMMGRTQSITTQTIRRINGMEYVETTTQSSGPIEDPQLLFQQFSNEEEFGDPLTPPYVSPSIGVQNRTASEVKEEVGVYSAATESGMDEAIKPKTKNKNKTNEEENDDEDDDDDDEFADASDLMDELDSPGRPNRTKNPNGSVAENKQQLDISVAPAVPPGSSNSEHLLKQNKNSRRPQQRSQTLQKRNDPKKSVRLSAHAYKSLSTPPQDELYDSSVRNVDISRKSTMSRRMTLREQPSPKSETENALVQAFEPLKTTNNKKGKRHLTDEEMYAIALQIAKEKHVSKENSLDMRRSEMTPILEDGDNTEMLPNKVKTISNNINEHNTSPLNTPSSDQPEQKKKAKRIIDKVIKFSQENSGYQPPKPKASKNVLSQEYTSNTSSNHSMSSKKTDKDLDSNRKTTDEKKLQKKKSVLARIFLGNKDKKIVS